MKRVSLLVGFAVVSLALLVIAMPARADDLTVGLVACYDLDEASGSRVDSWSTNDLTDNNTVGSNTGIIGNAAQFVSSNFEWLSIADNTAMSLGSDSDMTISGWLYADSLDAFNLVVLKGDNDNALLYEFWIRVDNSNFIEFAVGNGSTSATAEEPSAISVGIWYFFVGWHDSTNDTVNLQVNNGTVRTTSWSGGTQDTSDSFKIGRRTGAWHWNGRIDQVVYWKNQIVGPTDREWLYNSGAGRDCAEIANTVPTPTPTETPIPTGTPEPTVTPTPGPKIYEIDLPEGGRAEVVMSMTAGEFSVASLLAGIAALLLFAQLVNLAYMNTKR